MTALPQVPLVLVPPEQPPGVGRLLVRSRRCPRAAAASDPAELASDDASLAERAPASGSPGSGSAAAAEAESVSAESEIEAESEVEVEAGNGSAVAVGGSGTSGSTASVNSIAKKTGKKTFDASSALLAESATDATTSNVGIPFTPKLEEPLTAPGSADLLAEDDTALVCEQEGPVLECEDAANDEVEAEAEAETEMGAAAAGATGAAGVVAAGLNARADADTST
ncbi:MAG: hypothetical protein WBL35_04545, partial [Ornithinibacter sp.]